MNEEPTKDLHNRSSFEERVFARFDAFDARFDGVDARLEKLESRAYDTKPIWERALAKIMEMGLEVGEIKTKVGVIGTKVTVIETKAAVIETDVAGLKTDVAVMKTSYASIRNELTDVRRELRDDIKHQLQLILKFLLEDRSDIRDVEDRIRQLETKLA